MITSKKESISGYVLNEHQLIFQSDHGDFVSLHDFQLF